MCTCRLIYKELLDIGNDLCRVFNSLLFFVSVLNESYEILILNLLSSFKTRRNDLILFEDNI